MARPERVEYEGAYYHVMNRGRGRQQVFHDVKYYEYFLSCLEQAHKRFKLEIHGYCLMGNHYHLLVRTPRRNLSRAMRHINGVYTQHHNFLKQTDGSLFRGRYKAINIEASSYLLEVSRYIHRNPVETAKPLVKRLETYRWSSYPAYRNQVTIPEWLYKGAVLGELQSGQPTASYKRFVERGNDEETEKFYSKGHWPAVRGSEKFIDNAHLHSNASSKEVSRKRPVVDAQIILSLVCREYQCEQQELLIAKRGSGVDNTGRVMAMKLCQEYGSMKLSEIEKLFGIGSDSGVTKAVTRLTKRIAEDDGVGRAYNRLCQDLTP